MRDALRHTIRLLVAISLTAVALASCTFQEPGTNTVATTTPTSVTYPEGRYQLYGDGVTTAYYWVWVPAGTRAPAPPVPPPLPGRVAAPVLSPSEGYYRLYGDGATTPYYWAWIPAGAPTPPPPPPLRRS